MNKISYSQLSMFTECPLRWKLNYVDDLSIFEYNIYLIFGNAVHEVLQKYLEVLYYDSAKNADLLDLNEMLRDRLIENFKIAKEHDDKACCTKEDLQEFFEDGVAIIDFVKKRRNDYFGKRGFKLIGCEVPIDVKLKKNIKMVGYLDVVIHDEIHDRIRIIDIKTSTRGWNKWQKKDENKTQQLLLYKQFYAEQYNHPIDKIDIEYFIVKRKLWEEVLFPQKRVQKFVPASGKPSMNKVDRRLDVFLNEAFDDEGKYKVDTIKALPSKKACRFCEFNQTEHCSYGIK